MQNIRLFISSPGDVAAERQQATVVVEQINRILGPFYDVHIEVLDWRTHVAPDMGRPQEVINRQIKDYDIFLGIMWKRFGMPTGVAESGTKEEFDIAYSNWEKFRRPRILFYFNQTAYSPKTAKEASQSVKVLTFKERLGKKGLVCEYPSPEGLSFADLLRDHLALVLKELFPQSQQAPPIVDFSRYLTYLRDETMYIDIRGLVTGEGKVHQFRIDKIYIPLKTSGAGLTQLKSSSKNRRHTEEALSRDIPLQDALQEPRLIIRGDPGAGKTTFLRLITFTLCQRWLNEPPDPSTQSILWPEPMPLPIFVRLGTLVTHFRESKQNNPQHAPTQPDSPEWLLHFLAEQSRSFNWQVPAEAFRRELEEGHCLILLDGLDEAPDATTREQVSSLATNLFRAFPNCRVVLTSRPAALVGEAFPLSFSLIDIAPLDDAAMTTFLSQWCSMLYSEAPEKFRQHQQELVEALTARPEIRRMARTPVMLTALAVVHWNEHRLPEQRAELFESIITWLMRTRAQRPGRLKADRCRKLLQKLALAMFTHKQGRQRQVRLRWAAEALAPEFDATKESNAIQLADYFLRDEMVDSGIIVERGAQLEFWHLSFQEYLAAFEMAGLKDEERTDLLLAPDRLYSSEWRELVLLLAGVLYKQGKDKMEHLIDSIIDQNALPIEKADLPQLAKQAGLLGSLVRDLSPFEYQPQNPAYAAIMRRIEGIFDKAAYKKMPVQVRIEAADALGQAGDPRLERLEMVYISGGRFWMGAQRRDLKGRNFDPNADESYYDESPVHEVKLSPFYVSKYPITVGQYLRFIEDGGYEEERYWQAGNFGDFKSPDRWAEQLLYPSRPVVYVSWYEAAAYAHWAGGRLPSEAEWERAARGPADEYRKYPWGDEEPKPETTNFIESKIGHVTPVGIFPGNSSPEGVMDLAGNVWEWCEDWFSEDYYQSCARQGIVTDPRGPEKGDGRVVRGGSFGGLPDYLRCAVRYGSVPQDRDDYLGFRVVRGVRS